MLQKKKKKKKIGARGLSIDWSTWGTITPLTPNISMHILHTVLNTFPKVHPRRICQTVKIF